MASYTHEEVIEMQEAIVKMKYLQGNDYNALNDIHNLLDDMLIQGCVDCEAGDKCSCSGCNPAMDSFSGDEDDVVAGVVK